MSQTSSDFIFTLWFLYHELLGMSHHMHPLTPSLNLYSSVKPSHLLSVMAVQYYTWNSVRSPCYGRFSFHLTLNSCSVWISSLHTSKLCSKFIVQGPSWETNGPCGSTQNICSLWYLRPHYCVHTCTSIINPYTNKPSPQPQNYIFKIHLHKCLPNGLILSGFVSKFLYTFLMPTCVLYDLSISLPLNGSLCYTIYKLL
jgi:hypothetical protein